MPSPARRLDAALSAALTPLMAGVGFIRRRGGWMRRTADAAPPVTQWLAAEKGRFNTPRQASIALTVAAAPGAPADAADPAAVAASGRVFVSRPLATLTGADATGYMLAADEDEVAVARRIAEDVARCALPWFAQTATLDGLVRWLESEDERRGTRENGYILGRLLAEAGRINEARQHFEAADGVASVIIATAAAYGIRLDRS